MRMSAPLLMRAVAASVSLGGLNHSLTHTIFTLALGLVLRAPRAKLLMLRMTSGMGTEATTPSVPVSVMAPASRPAM